MLFVDDFSNEPDEVLISSGSPYLFLGDEILIEQSPIGGDGFLSNIWLLLLVLT